MEDDIQIICVTPVRNEAWILDRFLRSAGVWADRIIVADQGSTDGSQEIVRRHPKAILVHNPETGYDEGSRQRLLLAEARKVSDRRLIVALDADEALAGTVLESEGWQRLRRASPGTVVRFRWANILPGLARCWIPPHEIAFGYVDDGSHHTGQRIHSSRLPTPAGGPVVVLREPVVLHFQHAAWERMKAKQRWYQCWETLNHPEKRPVQIFRQYHRMDGFPEQEIHPVDPAWFRGYEARGIDMASLPSSGEPWWDAEVAEWLREHGPQRFRRIDIWDLDWSQVARQAHDGARARTLADPRNRAERAIHSWLRRTQRRAGFPPVRAAQLALRPFGW